MAREEKLDCKAALYERRVGKGVAFGEKELELQRGGIIEFDCFIGTYLVRKGQLHHNKVNDKNQKTLI